LIAIGCFSLIITEFSPSRCT